MKRASRLALAAIVVARIGTTASTARAAGDDVATAQVLFEDGKRLMARARWSEACPKLEESQRLAAAIGTEFNLADCWEHAGRLASAWAAFLDVVARTHERGEVDREIAARARADALAPKLGRLTIQVTARAPGLEVRRDGQMISPALWGVAVPVDAGDHRVEARAPGRASWASTVRTSDGQGSAIAIATLAAASATSSSSPASTPAPSPVLDASPSPAPPLAPSPYVTTDHTASLVAFGAAAIFAGVGVVGLVEHGANVGHYNADASCPPIDAASRPAHCTDYVDAAGTWTTVGVVGFVGSGVAIATGVALWVLAPSRPTATTARITCAPGLGAITCGGIF